MQCSFCQARVIGELPRFCPLGGCDQVVCPSCIQRKRTCYCRFHAVKKTWFWEFMISVMLLSPAMFKATQYITLPFWQWLMILVFVAVLPTTVISFVSFKIRVLQKVGIVESFSYERKMKGE